MKDITHIIRGSEGPAVKDIQERLCSIGYDLGDELARGVFGPLTARAVADFQKNAGLAPCDDIDRDTWTALVDATFTFGDRLLYLRMPYFHGRDVRTLQTALAALGFFCIADGIFGGHTERAVREFQYNAGIGGDGIVGDSTFSAIKRLRHAWEGKDQLASVGRSLGFARAEEVLENTPIFICGTDVVSRGVAKRISNLAMATTTASKIVDISSCERMPDESVLVLWLTGASGETEGWEPVSRTAASQSVVSRAAVSQSVASRAAVSRESTPINESCASRSAAFVAEGSIPQVVYDSDETINARMATALGLITGSCPQIVVRLAGISQESDLSAREEQHAAVVLLDALCLAF
jgi:peptidoglycan hydrolase-like protein with peptidoglycan-binding domain